MTVNWGRFRRLSPDRHEQANRDRTPNLHHQPMRLNAALPRQHNQPFMPVTHLTLADLRRVDTMDELNIEEIVARIEAGHEQHRPDLCALIASWRSRKRHGGMCAGSGGYG